MSTDAIVLLKNDHKEIRRVFRDFEGAGENATKRKGQLVEATEKFLMACFHYDSPKGNAAVALRVMQIGGIAFVGVMLVVFGAARASRRLRSKRS